MHAQTDQLGPYRIVAHLGRGGMADVHLAVVSGPTGTNFTKLAVVKRMRAEVADEPEVVSMFLHEARLLALLHHPNIVQVIEFGTHEGRAFLAMEYLDGLTLRRLRHRRSRGELPVTRDIEVVALVDTLAGLHHAHELRGFDDRPLAIVHRDVTPHNIVITIDGQVKVLDFGIAKAALRDGSTRQGTIKGKLRYMSPEQSKGAPVGVASDLFAVGISLWEALTGLRFWEGLTEQEVLSRLHAGSYETSARAVDPSVPEELDAVCRRALAYHPEDRYANAASMKEDLERALGERALAARKLLGPVVAERAAPDRSALRERIDEVARMAAEPYDLASSSERSIVLPAVPESAPATPPTPSLRATVRRRMAPSIALGLTALVILAVAATRSRTFAPTFTRSEPVVERSTLVTESDHLTRSDPSLRERETSRTPAHPVLSPRPRRTPAAISTSAHVTSAPRPALDPTDPWKTRGPR